MRDDKECRYCASPSGRYQVCEKCLSYNGRWYREHRPPAYEPELLSYTNSFPGRPSHENPKEPAPAPDGRKCSRIWCSRLAREDRKLCQSCLDNEARHRANRRARREAEPKPEGPVVLVGDCNNCHRHPREPGFKRCTACKAASRKWHEEHRDKDLATPQAPVDGKVEDMLFLISRGGERPFVAASRVGYENRRSAAKALERRGYRDLARTLLETTP